MSVQGYCQFLESLGHRIVDSGGHLWFNAHAGIYLNVVPHRIVVPGEVDARAILGRYGVAIRFPCPLDQGRGSFRIVIDDPAYGLSSLSGKARNQTRRGLENFEVRPVTFSELVQQGLRLNRDTMLRQGRAPGQKFEEYWIKYYSSAATAEGAEAWGAWCGGSLAAYLIAFVLEDVSHILIVRSSVDHLSGYPNNALIYSYVQDKLRNGGIREVSIGLESVQSGMETLDRFKEGMGFRKLPVGQHVLLRPSLDVLGKGLFRAATSWVSSRQFRSEFGRKFAGLMSWYLNQEVARK